MKSINISFSTVEELDKLLDNQAIKDSTKILIQLFYAQANIDAIRKIQLYFKNKFPNSTFLGTTTDGVIDGSKVYADTKSVVTFTSFKDTILKSTLLKHEDYNHDSFALGQAITQEICDDKTKVLISFADGINTNGEEYVNGISSINSSLTIAGGLAADNGELIKTYIFNKNEICSSGAIGVSLKGQSLNVTTNYTFDWMPIGKKLRVTKSIKNRIYEIEGIPVVDIYAKYMGKELAEHLPQVGIEFPLIFEKDGVSIGRAVLLKHDDGSLTFAGNIQEGEMVRFGVGNIEMILRNSDYHIRTLIEKMTYQPQALFIYSCMARRRFMNKYSEDELEVLKNIGSFSGFFTYGEFFHSQGNNQLLNETMTVLALSEGRELLDFTLQNSIKKRKDFTINAEHVIAHLANSVSNELAELNENLEKRIQESSDYIYKQAYFNELTGLPNRLSLIKKLDESIGQIVFLINIDDFTTINDFYGLEIGDKVLKKLAYILEKFAQQQNSQAFRLPSDEFAIIMDIKHNRHVIEDKIKELVNVVEKEKFLFNGHFTHVSVTISAASIYKNRSGLANADMSLKLAKKAGKEFMIFDEDLKLAKQYEDNINMVNTIKQAINFHRIIPYFQPIFDTKTGKVEKYESLVRLKKEDGEVLSPFFFLEISQKVKLYPQITKIMVEKSFSYFAKNGLNFTKTFALSEI